MDLLRKARVERISLQEGMPGDGKFRVANSTGRYKMDDKRSFSLCKLSGGPGYFTVHWREKDGARTTQWVRIHPVEPDGVRGTWAVAWEPGTDVLWWMDDADIGRMTLTDPKQVVVERSARVGERPPGFVPPDGVRELFEHLGFHKGLWNRGADGGDGNLWKRVMEATPVEAPNSNKEQPKADSDDIKESDPAPSPAPMPSVFQPSAKPASTRLHNDRYSAYAVQPENVQFWRMM
jgi:hypothetical protein